MKKRTSHLLVALVNLGIFFASTVAAAEMYRCKKSDGKWVYQDKSCVGSKETDGAYSPPPAVVSSSTSATNYKFKRGCVGIPAEEKPKALIGISRDELIKLCGQTSNINKTVSKYGVREQWVYEIGAYNVYFYLDDGLVTSYQD